MKKILIILGIAMLLFAGCENSGSTSTGNIISAGFKGGNGIVEMEYEDNMPPKEIRDDGAQTFNIRFKLTNNGEYEIPQGKAHIRLAGFAPSEFGVTNSQLQKSLPKLIGYKKRNDDLIDPVSKNIMFSGFKYVNDLGGASEINKNIYAFLCYPYKTEALGVLCVKPNTYGTNDDSIAKTCEIEGNKQLEHSRAPVSIENLEEMILSNTQIQFQFDIVKKQSNVNIYRSDSLDSNCKINGKELSEYDSDLEKNIVKFEVTGLDSIKCNGAGNTGEVDLGTNGKINILCDVSVAGEVDREVPITINLDYDVVSRADTSLKIYNIDTN